MLPSFPQDDPRRSAQRKQIPLLILPRHIFRELVTPFLYALFVITALFLVDFIVQIMDSILTKGLEWRVVLELFLLNTAWMLALSVPMSVLVATLMAFGRMSADREIDAMRTAGVGPIRQILPALLPAMAMAAGLVWFNNRVLPEANFRASSLREDISRKRPAVLLEPRTMIQEFDGFRIWIQSIDPGTDSLRGILIHQLDRNGAAPTIVTGRQGTVHLSPDGRTWKFDLQGGETHSPDRSEPGRYVRIAFQRLMVEVPNVDSRLHRSDKTYRSDREMPIEEMQVRVNGARQREASLVTEQGDRLFTDLRFLTNLLEIDSLAHAGVAPRDSIVDSNLAKAAAPVPPKAKAGKKTRQPATIPDQPGSDQGLRALANGRLIHSPEIVVPPTGENLKQLLSSRQRQARLSMEQIRGERTEADRFLVEIHKKFSIPAACIVFVLIGAPLGVMARSGGVGTGVAYSLAFFILYWACLIGGESLADRGLVEPAIAMWSPNIFLALVGMLLVSRMGREVQFFQYRWLGSIARRLGLRKADQP